MTAADKLRALHEAATPGPWGHSAFEVYCDDSEGGCHEDHEMCRLSGAGETIADVYGLESFAERDARLIATLRTVLPELVAVVEAAQASSSSRPGCALKSTAALDALDRALEAGGEGS